MKRISPWVLAGLVGACTASREVSSNALARVEKAAAVYDGTPGAEDPATAGLRSLVEGSLAPIRDRLTHDPRLDVAALVSLEHFSAKGKALPRSEMQWVLWRTGVPGHQVSARVWTVAGKKKVRK